MTPSPTIATRWPRCCSSVTAWSLSSGSTSANTSLDPEVAADRLGDLRGVAGDHRHVEPSRAQLVDRLTGLGTDLVLEGEGSDDLVVAHEVEHRSASLRPATRRLRRATAEPRAARSRNSRGPPTAYARAVDRRLDAAAGEGAELAGAAGSSPRSFAAATIARRQRVLAVGLDGGGEA